MRTHLTFAAVIALHGSLLSAQPAPDARQPVAPFTLSAIGGVTAGGSEAGGTFGATAGFQATPRIALEARGAFSRRGAGAAAIEATATMLITLARSARWAPYGAIGGGLYHAIFDLDDIPGFGAIGRQFAGWPMTPLQGQPGFMFGAGPVLIGGSMPRFYRDRLGEMRTPFDGHWGRRSFTEPALVFGGGAHVDLTPHLFLRPDVRALVVVGRHDTLTVTAMTVGFGYGF